MNQNLDTQLSAYLTAWQEDQSSGNTIANLRIELHQVKLNVEELTTQNTLLRMRLDRHGQEIRMIKQHLALSGEGEDTGQHQVEDLKRALANQEKELEKHEEAGRWWKRKAVGWVVAAAAWIITSIVAVAAWAVTHPSPPPSREPPTFERGSK